MRTNSEGDDRAGRSFAGVARRQQITEAAVDVLAANGYAATSIAAIADQIKISKGVVSYHFSGKAELMCEVVRSVLSGAEQWMAPRVAGATSYREALRLYIATNISFLDGHRVQMRALTEVLANAQVTPGVPELLQESQRSAEEALAALFAGGQQAGEFGDVPARILAMALRATIDATSGRLRREPDFDLTSFEQDLVLLIERAVADGTKNAQKTADRAARRSSRTGAAR